VDKPDREPQPTIRGQSRSTTKNQVGGMIGDERASTEGNENSVRQVARKVDETRGHIRRSYKIKRKLKVEPTNFVVPHGWCRNVAGRVVRMSYATSSVRIGAGRVVSLESTTRLGLSGWLSPTHGRGSVLACLVGWRVTSPMATKCERSSDRCSGPTSAMVSYRCSTTASEQPRRVPFKRRRRRRPARSRRSPLRLGR
jgi:hypothetical protein